MDATCCDGSADLREELKEFFILEEGRENSSWSSNEFAMTPKELIPMSAPAIDGVSIILAEGSRAPAASGSPTWYKRKHGN